MSEVDNHAADGVGTPGVTADDLLAGIGVLDRLSRGDYHASLGAIYGAPEPEAVSKLGRLIGVTLKEPFATPNPRATPSEFTGSLRDWELNVDALRSEDTVETWQHRTLTRISSELGYADVVALAVDAQNERGFFNLFAISLRKYICDDPEIRDRVKNDLDAARAAGVQAAAVTPEAIVASGGAGLATYLVMHIPLLGFVGVPVIVGIILLLYRAGIDAFCQTSAWWPAKE
ncbi:MAG TPA: hypothetical protein VFO25_08320 [Candidatus Eremiobacteraceae bacterium]|nr:hypothetical protein [Candidatus Eremiobacteraceae bacterium]